MGEVKMMGSGRVLALVVTMTVGFAVGAVGHAEARSSDGLQCGKRLVNVGDSKLAVIGKCGEPQLKERRLEPRRDAEGRDLWVTVDEWSYDPGGKQFLRVVAFERGRVVRIQAVSR